MLLVRSIAPVRPPPLGAKAILLQATGLISRESRYRHVLLAEPVLRRVQTALVLQRPECEFVLRRQRRHLLFQSHLLDPLQPAVLPHHSGDERQTDRDRELRRTKLPRWCWCCCRRLRWRGCRGGRRRRAAGAGARGGAAGGGGRGAGGGRGGAGGS